MASRLGYRVFLRHHAGWESQGPRREPTHRVVVGVQVGHEHGSQGAQDPVHTVPIVAAQLPEGALPAVQQQGRVGAVGDGGGGTHSGRRAGQYLSPTQGGCPQGEGGLTSVLLLSEDIPTPRDIHECPRSRTDAGHPREGLCGKRSLAAGAPRRWWGRLVTSSQEEPKAQ